MEGKEFREKVVLAVVPESVEHHEKGGALKGDTLFWLHTNGMSQFGVPEFEIRHVPARFVEAAAGELNHWGSYFADGPALEVGELLQISEVTIPVFVKASVSDHPFWEEDGRVCLTLTPEAVAFQCVCCKPP